MKEKPYNYAVPVVLSNISNEKIFSILSNFQLDRLMAVNKTLQNLPTLMPQLKTKEEMLYMLFVFIITSRGHYCLTEIVGSCSALRAFVLTHAGLYDALL